MNTDKTISEHRQQDLFEDGHMSTEEVTFFAVGKRYHRQSDLHNKYGGNRQSGISACSKHPIIFLFSAPTGKESGYEDGFVSNDTYIYSGEGSVGDMEFTRGNKAILNHQAEGRELHLFKKEKSGLYQYIGQFEYASHKKVEGDDIEGNKRKLIQFTLNRIN